MPKSRKNPARAMKHVRNSARAALVNEQITRQRVDRLESVLHGLIEQLQRSAVLPPPATVGYSEVYEPVAPAPSND